MSERGLIFALRWAFRAESPSSNPRRRNEMTRSVLAVLAVFLVAAAPSSAAGSRDAQDPVLDSYIVVLKPDAARSAAAAPLGAAARGRRGPGAESGSRWCCHLRLPVRAQGLCRPAVRRPGRGPDQRPSRRLRRAGPGLPHARDPDPGHVGARSDRPARPAAQQHLQLQPDGAGRSRLRHRHRASAPATRSSPAGSGTASRR